MPTKAGQNSVKDEIYFERSMHLIQCTGTGQDCKECVVWTPIWFPKRISRNFNDRSTSCGFWSASGFK